MDKYTILSDGNMNPPYKSGDKVYKEVTMATNNVHALLIYLCEQGIDWVPKSFGINEKGLHELSYIEGLVPHDNPDWIWNEDILTDVAVRLRQWHDATLGFKPVSDQWLIKTGEPNEVICHNDFAPYNCVFVNNKFAGLIDFDTCSPGTRLWDIAYTAYRFVPLYPNEDKERYLETSPFSTDEMLSRLELFLKTYGGNEEEFRYNNKSIIDKLLKRLEALANWSFNFGKESGNQDIINHAAMYLKHSEWIAQLEHK